MVLKDQRFRGLARSSSLSDDSRARGRQRDLLGPPQGRRRFHFFREIRFGAAAIAASVSGATGSGRLGGAAAAGRRAHEVDSATRWGRHLAAAADSIFLEKFGSGPRRLLRRSAERPARAAWAALRLLADVALGATRELGRSWRTPLMMMLRPRGAGELRGHRQQAALKLRQFRAAGRPHEGGQIIPRAAADNMPCAILSLCNSFRPMLCRRAARPYSSGASNLRSIAKRFPTCRRDRKDWARSCPRRLATYCPTCCRNRCNLRC